MELYRIFSMLLYYFTQFFYLKLSFKLKIDRKKSTFKNLEKLRKPRRNFSKTFGHPDNSYSESFKKFKYTKKHLF